ncbi:MAG: posphoenolpyruvate synthetase regulatory kinase/phosphorylase PpsR [Legionella sp.]
MSLTVKRFVYMISDGTGITAESLGNSLVSQFEQIDFEKKTIPYVDTKEKANEVVALLNSCYQQSGIKPLVFMTLVNPEISAQIKQAHAKIFDLFSTFLDPLEQELNTKSSYTVGRTHGVANVESYNLRIEAVNYALEHDDGVKIRGYQHADIILIGVSRCGKTPSCLYMALQFGIMAANYPFAEDELIDFCLPTSLKPFKAKLFGLTIDPLRLHQIRTERRPNSLYASTEQCRLEIAEVEEMYKREAIPYLNTTRYSIEEITTKIMASAGIQRKI